MARLPGPRPGLTDLGVLPGGDRMRPLIIGGGPAGTAAAITLAERGVPARLIDRRDPRAPDGRVCGGLLTPRAVRLLDALGIDARPLGRSIDSIDLMARGRQQRIEWPTSIDTGSNGGIVLSRDRLDAALLARAGELGVDVELGREALEPVIERGFVRGVRTVAASHEMTEPADLVLVADGANSTFGRALGTSRRQDWPYVSALRVVLHGTTTDRTNVEFHFDLERGPGDGLPGFGWVFPGDDDTVNIGVQVSSTARDATAVNLHALLEQLIERVADRWGVAEDPAEAAERAEGARTPVGDSIVPVAGPNFLVAGDAAGQANPLTGAGIEAALRLGIEAGEVMTAATRTAPDALQGFVPRVRAIHADHHKTGRQIVRLTGRPFGSRLLATIATTSWGAPTVMRFALAEFRSSGGAAETLHSVTKLLGRVAPEA